MKKLLFPITVVLETFIFYILAIIPFEYLLTEKYYLYQSISGETKTTVFLIIFLIVFGLNYLIRAIKKISLKIWPALIILFIGALVLNKQYAHFYDRVRQEMKIIEVNDGQNWSIQGMSIRIEGRSFGEAWQQGKVFIGDMELNVKSWSPNLVVAEQPVPGAFPKKMLYLLRYDGKESNRVPFEIKDPVFLAE